MNFKLPDTKINQVIQLEAQLHSTTSLVSLAVETIRADPAPIEPMLLSGTTLMDQIAADICCPPKTKVRQDAVAYTIYCLGYHIAHGRISDASTAALILKTRIARISAAGSEYQQYLAARVRAKELDYPEITGGIADCIHGEMVRAWALFGQHYDHLAPDYADDLFVEMARQSRASFWRAVGGPYSFELGSGQLDSPAGLLVRGFGDTFRDEILVGISNAASVP